MLRNYEALSNEVNLLGVIKARGVIGRYLNRTNLTYYSELSRLMGCDVYVKHENHNPTGSFKIRGALNFIQHVSGEELQKRSARGDAGQTRPGHGLRRSLVRRAHHRGGPRRQQPRSTASYEASAPSSSSTAMTSTRLSRTSDELVDSAGFYYVEQGNEPAILNGLGTMGLEIFEDLPDVDTIVCPIGGGAGCASLIKVAQALAPNVDIIGVQPEQAAAFHASWNQGERVILESCASVADGLAARSPFQLPYLIMKDHISDVVLVSEEEILEGIRLALQMTHNLAEGAGAASIAGALKISDRLAGKKVVVIMSGGNLDQEHLQLALGQ